MSTPRMLEFRIALYSTARSTIACAACAKPIPLLLVIVPTPVMGGLIGSTTKGRHFLPASYQTIQMASSERGTICVIKWQDVNHFWIIAKSTAKPS